MGKTQYNDNITTLTSINSSSFVWYTRLCAGSGNVSQMFCFLGVWTRFRMLLVIFGAVAVVPESRVLNRLLRVSTEHLQDFLRMFTDD